MRALLFLALSALAALSACGSSSEQEANTVDPEMWPGDGAPAPPAPVGPSPEELAALEDENCLVVADAYVNALSRGAFEYAALFWDDPVIDADRISALFSRYVTPRITLGDVQEEGAAGTIYCTIPGELSDASNPGVEVTPGEIVLGRANDIPGASEDQLRWTLRSSTFVEQMDRARRETAD